MLIKSEGWIAKIGPKEQFYSLFPAPSLIDHRLPKILGGQNHIKLNVSVEVFIDRSTSLFENISTSAPFYLPKGRRGIAKQSIIKYWLLFKIYRFIHKSNPRKVDGSQ